MSVAWHRNRRWDWFVSENEKMEIDPMFIKSYKSASSIQIGGIELFYLRDVFWPKVLKHFKHKNLSKFNQNI